ncbi:ABC transporter family substrate-binding protein [Streptacidiphilus sp. ASG 303]|uniref:ABC transporter family substrate-binding protein n=1 Tax=Streptacidiphilus sp. ASG 303 TaxID=2896847 RepID=UPI001E3247C5|nr:ABC transporter family substrate-binding protein [Streptacidiphilus sp. ASG 303]MCD0485691.1 ABC transporter family substrate-binding protein [Streptacidiphilus sp. ASG 303]
MKHSRIPLALVASVAVASLSLTACGSGGGDKKADPAASKSAENAVKITTSDNNTVPREKLKKGGTLTWAIDQYSEQWNYLQINGAEYSTDAVMEALLPVPFHVDEKSTPYVAKEFFSDVQQSTKDGKQVVTYDINPKAKWSDGSPITWKDLASEANALSGKDAKFQVGSTTGYEDIESVVKGTSDQQAVVTFKKNFGDWTGLFAPLYPAKYTATADAFNKGYLNKIPMTAGPFKLQSMNATTKTVTVVRNPDWWAEPAILDKIIFRALTTDAAPGAYANGEIDFVNIGPSAAGFKQAQGRTDGEIREAAGPQFRHFTFNTKSPVLGDVGVRKGIAQAINREAIAKSDLQGLNWPPLMLNNHFFVNGQKGYQDNSGDVGKYDPAAAKATLDSAGWKMNGQYRQKDGKTLEVSFVYPDGTAVSENEGKLAQKMLQQVGVKLDIKAVPSDDFFDKYVQPGKFDITAFSWLGNAWPVSSNKSIYQSPKGDNNFQNFAWYANPAIDAAMAKSVSDLDPAQAIADTNAADKLIWQGVTVFPLYQRPAIFGAKKTLANLGSPQNQQEVVYQNIGFTG